MNNNRVSEILSWYPSLTNMQRHNLLRIIRYGRIGGSGKFVILPVDQGFEHGPGRSFQPNPAGYDPLYHAQLAVDAGCNAYAAPLGALEAAMDVTAMTELPTILKVNSHDLMMPDGDDPFPAVTSWVDDAIRLNCAAVGFTIYPGSNRSREMYGQVRELVDDAKAAGKVVVIWAYPRGSGLPSKDSETAVDICCYAVHIGAHIIKCKPTKDLIGLPDHIKKGTYDGIPIDTLADRTKLVIKSAFNGHRIVINSGGEAKGNDEVLEEIRQLKDGGSFGSIVGRNAFQRPRDESISLLHQIQDIYTE
jgi:class I fructose-bisphosphate aldolase